MADQPPVLWQTEGAAALVTLNRPARLNALDRATVGALGEAFRRATAEEGVRAVLLRGAGRGFCAGADLVELASHRDEGAEGVRRALSDLYLPLFEAIRGLPKPVLVAVQGPAVGIGASLALAGDLVVAARSAYLALSFVNVGLAPDGGATLLVGGRAGLARYLELALLGERLPAPKAYEWGLVNRVVDDGELEKETLALVRRLSEGPTLAYGAIKRTVAGLLAGPYRHAFALEAQAQAALATSADVEEGVTAFVERRKARFSGR